LRPAGEIESQLKANIAANTRQDEGRDVARPAIIKRVRRVAATFLGVEVCEESRIALCTQIHRNGSAARLLVSEEGGKERKRQRQVKRPAQKIAPLSAYQRRSGASLIPNHETL